MICSDCRFFVRGMRWCAAAADGWTDGPDFKHGECRIRSVDRFPRRALDDWCGEWQERPEERMDTK